MGIFDKAKDAATEHSDQVDKGLDIFPAASPLVLGFTALYEL